MVDTTGTHFSGNVFAYSITDFTGLSTWSIGSSFNLNSGATPDSININAANTNPFLINTGSTMTATGTVTGQGGDINTFAGGTFNTTNVWQFSAPDGKSYWVAKIVEPSTGAESYISNHILDPSETYTFQVMDDHPESGTNPSGNTIWGDQVRVDQAASPDSPAASADGYAQMAVWSSDDLSFANGTLSVASGAQAGTFTTFDNDGFINDGTAAYNNSVNDTDQIGYATFSHGPAAIPQQIYQGEVGYLLWDPVEMKEVKLLGISFGSTYSSKVVYFSTSPLVAGRDYTVRYTDGTPGGNNNNLTDGEELSFNYSLLQPPLCFAAGTLIETDRGPRPVETLCPGDLVATRDHGLQPVRWIGGRDIPAADLAQCPKLRPIRIGAGALGAGKPARDLVVSRQHRVLIRSAAMRGKFGADEVLLPAKDLLDLVAGVESVPPGQGVRYFHILFDGHEIVTANGIAAESLLPGAEALKSVRPAALVEIYRIFPELRDRNHVPVPARKLVRGARARACIRSHLAKGDAMLARG